MILAFVLAPIRVVAPAPPGVSIGPARLYKAVKRKVAFDDGRVAVVRGRRVSFRPTPNFDHLMVDAVGRDGTVLLRRSSLGNYVTTQDSIVRGRVETPVKAWGHPAFVDVYLDTRNYAGGFFADDDDASGVHPPFGPVIAFVVENGKHRRVGLGDVKSWQPGGPTVTELKQDAKGNPANWEMDGETHTHLYQDGRDYDLGSLTFALRLPTGENAFADGRSGLFRWSHRALRPWVRLPAGWVPVAANRSGGLLVRNRESWETGILRGRVLTPLSFVPPAGVDVDWVETREFGADGRFRVYATDHRGRSLEITLRPR